MDKICIMCKKIFNLPFYDEYGIDWEYACSEKCYQEYSCGKEKASDG